MKFKSIKSAAILTGGSGSRLSPLTNVISKHLITLNNKFIIDYPLISLKEMGVENLTVILGSTHFEQIVEYLKDGEAWGLNINYVYQNQPKGIAHAINLCERSLSKDDDFVVLLGDNIYLNKILPRKEDGKAQIVLTEHEELYRLGTASINKKGKITKLEEKPKIIDTQYKNYAITGCYFFDQQFFEYFKKIKPSARGEFEIISILDCYHQNNKLTYSTVSGWIDAGTFPSLEEASQLLNKKI